MAETTRTSDRLAQITASPPRRTNVRSYASPSGSRVQSDWTTWVLGDGVGEGSGDGLGGGGEGDGAGLDEAFAA